MTTKQYALAVLLSLLALPAAGQEPAQPPVAAPTVHSSITLTLASEGDAEKRVVRYTCEGAEPFSVEYINAQPNFLALVPIEGRTTIFVAVMSASGARYVSGEYEWWTSGPDGTLRNLAGGEEEPPLATCAEFSNAP